jgi:catechol 2,3-dioxygenase-like lactoylglutathione lyase family enzyme
MAVTQFMHAAILVTDLEKSAFFYGTILGIPQVERNLKFPGIWYQIGNFQIHLITTSSLITDEVDGDKWGRNRHLAFAVTNLEESKKQLLSHNYPIQKSASGRPALFTKDPDHNIIELSQLAE